MQGIEEMARIAVDCGFKIHNSLGPGLLESVYEVIMADSLAERGLSVERQKSFQSILTAGFSTKDLEQICLSRVNY